MNNIHILYCRVKSISQEDKKMKTYIIAAKRTAIGSYLGSLSAVHPAQFAAETVKAVLDYGHIPPDAVDELIAGNVLPAGQGQGIARQIAIKATLPQCVPAYSVNMVCGSGLKSIMNAALSIQVGYSDIIIAGGVESMSDSPYLMPSKTRSGIKMGSITMKDHMVYDALTDAFSGVHMGMTAENIAEKYNITRQEQDEFSLNSQIKAIAAVDGGLFNEEIVPITVTIKRQNVLFDKDEYPNRTTNIEKLSALEPVFKQGGTVTAGNSSGLNDGAAFVAVASERAVEKYNLKPIAEIISFGQGGVDPQYMGIGPVPAIKDALSRAGLSLKDIDIIELNEAFAAQSIAVINLLSQEHNIDKDSLLKKTNIRGGAIALGHPVGASGTRILVTLLHELMQTDAKMGLASLCIGGGMGTAMVVKKV
jgi:acetyl-CoA C-acetyltransferase